MLKKIGKTWCNYEMGACCLQSGWGYAAAASSNREGAGYTGGLDGLDLGGDSEYSDDDSEGSESEEE